MALKAYKIDPRLNPVLLEAAERAEPVVERALGDAAGRVEVAWEPGDDRHGEPTARILLTDTGVTRTGEFTAWDFEDEFVLGWRLRRVWDSVLVERIRQTREAIHRGLADSAEE